MNALTFRLLEVFQRVVDLGSITAASTSLSLSQPTVSLQLKKLSSQIGMPLIEQHQGSIIMTDAGHAVYRCAQEVLTAHARLNSQIAALQGVEVGSLKLAVVTTAKYVIPPLLSEFCRAHPNIEINFTVGNRAQIIQRLTDNKDDLYIFSQPPEDAELVCYPFAENKLQVVAPCNYSGPNNCQLADLAEEKFLLREPGSGTRRLVDQYCRQNGVILNKVMIVESNEAIRLSVASGLGLAILSQHTLANSRQDDLKTLDIKDFPLKSHWQVVTHKRRPISLAASAFRDSLIDAFNQPEKITK
ncbi:LysR family transcriptional regulator [Alteromonas sediminis]|uniref:LysR family transcriptional regulator n=1 Tax=Alteromonas sediminis TaxID=2259342 RepID=A0A3N5XZX9_9ALTE|nr:LysR family transcriptional regulator [Alteromonas sediminis]RPJ66320.1 LysR family transcriptional regulator [Alteromonas sediminis]